jgi:tetratricopeptide (TPR) repeat protein
MSAPLSGSYEELATQAQQHLRSSEYAQAQAIYERIYNRLSKMKDQVIDRRPNLKQLKLTSLRMLGDLSVFQQAFDQAIQYYEAGLTVDPAEALIYHRAIAQVKIDKGDVADGLDELRALAVSNAGQPQCWIWLGLELWAQEKNDEALESLKRAADLAAGDTNYRSEAYSYLHDIYREEGQLDEAAAAWEQAWHVMGRNMTDVSPMYQMYFEVDDLDKANHWLKQEQNPLRAGFYRGLFAQSAGQEGKATSAWKKTAKLNPLEHPSGHEAWAEAALRVNHPPQAIIYALREIVSREALNIRGTILLAVAQARRRNLSAATMALKAAIDLNQRTRPRRDLLTIEHWHLLDELVEDEEAKQLLRPYFEAAETEDSRQEDSSQ